MAIGPTNLPGVGSRAGFFNGLATGYSAAYFVDIQEVLNELKTLKELLGQQVQISRLFFMGLPSSPDGLPSYAPYRDGNTLAMVPDLSTLPTTPDGLETGDLWNNQGVCAVV